MLTEEVRQLRVLVHYLLAQFGTKTPVPLGVLKPVARRLDDLHLLLQNTIPDQFGIRLPLYSKVQGLG